MCVEDAVLALSVNNAPCWVVGVGGLLNRAQPKLGASGLALTGAGDWLVFTCRAILRIVPLDVGTYVPMLRVT